MAASHGRQRTARNACQVLVGGILGLVFAVFAVFVVTDILCVLKVLPFT